MTSVSYLEPVYRQVAIGPAYPSRKDSCTHFYVDHKTKRKANL